MYQLVFRGECTTGTDLATARASAQALFKATLEQVDRMFSGQPVVIRNKLDAAQAKKYRLVLQKHGMVAYVEAMPGTQPDEPRRAPAPAASATSAATGTASAPAPKPSAPGTASVAAGTAGAGSAGKTAGPVVEPGDRPRLAGEKVDDILAGSGLSLDPPGVTLVNPERPVAPLFRNLDSWTIAPAGSELGEKRETPPPITPDISHLSLADDDR